jgi:hypothetical protein
VRDDGVQALGLDIELTLNIRIGQGVRMARQSGPSRRAMLARLRCGQRPVVMAVWLWFVLLVRCDCPDRSASMGNSGHEHISGRRMGRTPPDGCKALVSQARHSASARVSAYAPVPVLTQRPDPMLAPLQQRSPTGGEWRNVSKWRPLELPPAVPASDSRSTAAATSRRSTYWVRQVAQLATAPSRGCPCSRPRRRSVPPEPT